MSDDLESTRNHFNGEDDYPHSESELDEIPESLDDMRASIKYLKERLNNCASANHVEAIEDNVRLMVQALLDERNNCACQNVSLKVDTLCAAANDFQTSMRKKTDDLAADVERITAKHRDTRSSTNTCIKDIKVLRQAVKDLRHKQKPRLVEEGSTAMEVDQATTHNHEGNDDETCFWQDLVQTCVKDIEVLRQEVKDLKHTQVLEEETRHTDRVEADRATTLPEGNDDAIFWENLVQKAYNLPTNVDLSKVRIDNKRQSILRTRITNQKWYIDRSKMDFSGEPRDHGVIRAAHVPEFLRCLKEDVPAVRIWKKGKLYKASK